MDILYELVEPKINVQEGAMDDIKKGKYIKKT